MKPMFQSLIAHERATYTQLTTTISLWEAAILEDCLVAELETKRRAQKAQKQESEDAAELRKLQRERYG